MAPRRFGYVCLVCNGTAPSDHAICYGGYRVCSTECSERVDAEIRDYSHSSRGRLRRVSDAIRRARELYNLERPI